MRFIGSCCSQLHVYGPTALPSSVIPITSITFASEAIRCGTINGAHATFEEKHKGSIEPGKLADLAVLTEDPFKVEPQNLHKIAVERTMVGGEWVYES